MYAFVRIQLCDSVGNVGGSVKMKAKIIFLAVAALLVLLGSLQTQYTYAQEETVSVTFSVSGLGDDVLDVACLNVDGENYTAAELPVTFNWTVGSTHSFRFYSPIEKEYTYLWKSTSGLVDYRYGNITISQAGEIHTEYTSTLYPSPAKDWLSNILFGTGRWIFILIMIVLAAVLLAVARGTAAAIIYFAAFLIFTFVTIQYAYHLGCWENTVCAGVSFLLAAVMFVKMLQKLF